MAWLKMVGLRWIAGMFALAACASDAAHGAGSDGQSSTGATSAETAVEGSSSETGDSSPVDPALPLDCGEVPTTLSDARWWTSFARSQFTMSQQLTAIAGGRAAWLVDDALSWIDEAGDVAAPVTLAPDEHPTALASTVRGTVLLAGWRDAGITGEVDAFAIELRIDGTRAAETTWGLEPDANERPIAIVAAAEGPIAVITEVSFDATMPNAQPFVRLDRLDGSLALVHDMIVAAPADFAIDDEGTAYLAGTGGSLGVAAIDAAGATRWSSFATDHGGAVAMAVGADVVWIAQASTEAFGGGELRGVRRLDGELVSTTTFAGDDLSQPIETPIDVAASPCGGAWLVADGRFDGIAHVTLSHFTDDGTRGPITEASPPPSSSSYGDISGISSAPDGTVVVGGRLVGEDEVWTNAF